MTTQNIFHLLAVAVCYKLSPSRIYNSSSSGVYMKWEALSSLNCSAVLSRWWKSLFLRPEECRSSFSQFSCARRWRANWVQRWEKQQPLVLWNSQKEILNDVSLAFQAEEEQYFHQLHDLNSAFPEGTARGQTVIAHQRRSQMSVFFPPTSSLEPEHVFGTAGGILNPTEGQPEAKISRRICFH